MQHIKEPTIVKACGNKEKIIKEYIGRVNTNMDNISIAFMDSPGGWEEPGQTPKFDEYTLVLEGSLRVTTKNQEIDVGAGEAVIAEAGEWVKYSTPNTSGAQYVAVCLPAFGPDIVHRDES